MTAAPNNAQLQPDVIVEFDPNASAGPMPSTSTRARPGPAPRRSGRTVGPVSQLPESRSHFFLVQTKKYSTASKRLTSGTLTLIGICVTRMNARFGSELAQLWDVGKDLFMSK
jgi:hypothetical protein